MVFRSLETTEFRNEKAREAVEMESIDIETLRELVKRLD